MVNITPISNINTLQELFKNNQASSSDTANSLPFQSIFEDAVNNVIETQKEVDRETLLLATGQTDDLHNLNIASTKASLSVDLLVQLRNKTLDSYNELMRMNI